VRQKIVLVYSHHIHWTSINSSLSSELPCSISARALHFETTRMSVTYRRQNFGAKWVLVFDVNAIHEKGTGETKYFFVCYGNNME